MAGAPERDADPVDLGAPGRFGVQATTGAVQGAVSPDLAAQVRAQLAKDHEKVAGLIRQDRCARGRPATPDRSGVAGALLAMLTGYSQRLAVSLDIDAAAFRQALQALLGDAT